MTPKKKAAPIVHRARLDGRTACRRYRVGKVAAADYWPAVTCVGCLEWRGVTPKERAAPKTKERPVATGGHGGRKKRSRATDTAPLEPAPATLRAMGDAILGLCAVGAAQARAAAALVRDQTHPLTFECLRRALPARGTWRAKSWSVFIGSDPYRSGVLDDPRDAVLAAEAVNAAPELLAEVDRLRSRVRELESKLHAKGMSMAGVMNERDRLRAEVETLRVELAKHNGRAFAEGLRKGRR